MPSENVSKTQPTVPVVARATMLLPVLVAAYGIAGLIWRPLVAGPDMAGVCDWSPPGSVILPICALLTLLLLVFGPVMMIPSLPTDIRRGGKWVLASGVLLIPATILLAVAVVPPTSYCGSMPVG